MTAGRPKTRQMRECEICGGLSYNNHFCTRQCYRIGCQNQSAEVIEHRAIMNTGQKRTQEQKERIRDGQTPYSEIRSNRWLGEKNPNYCGRIIKDMWQDPEYIKKVRIRKPISGLEQRFIELTKQYSLSYQYVGDFQLNIGGKFPDFWDGEKKLIEIFGYYHKPEQEQGRIKHFRDHGYQCLVIWACELNKNNLQNTMQRVIDFNNLRV